MGFEKILNDTSVLRYIHVSIDGEQLFPHDILSIEFAQNFDEFGIGGHMLFRDTFDINNNGLITLNGDNKLVISVKDFLGTSNKRTFRIVNTTVEPSGDRFKLYKFFFIDEITFQLMNSYVSKSFTGTPVAAFQSYMTELGIDKLLSADKLTTNITDTSTSDSFVVPQNISVLDFFTERFKQENIRIWQDRNGLYIKEINIGALTPMQNDGKDIVYSNKTLNNEYLYKVHEYMENKNSVMRTNSEKPIMRTFRYNNDKKIVDLTRNLTDVVPNIKLNTLDATGLQLTTGEKYDKQSFFTTGNQDYELFDSYGKNNSIDIVCSGSLKDSNIGNVALLELNGVVLSSDTALKGDVLTGGKYFISKVTDKIMGDKYINKITLSRVDARTPR